MNWYSRDMNDGQSVFVFGSNLAGIHGAGAAHAAAEFWGAVRGKGNGRQGQAYGIPTKDMRIKTLPLDFIKRFVGEFTGYAKQHPEIRFLVTEIGCGLAGYTTAQIAPFFARCPDNCILPDSFTKCLKSLKAAGRGVETEAAWAADTKDSIRTST